MSSSELSAIWIDGESVEFTNGSRLDSNLRELNINSVEPLTFVQDKVYSVRVALTRGDTYEGRMSAGLETMVVRDEVRGTLYTCEFTSSTELAKN